MVAEVAYVANAVYMQHASLRAQPCNDTFDRAGFRAGFNSMENFAAKAKQDMTLNESFLASRAKLIELVNNGTINRRLRGQKKKDVQNAFSEVRKKAVKVVQEESVNVNEDFDAQTVQRYKELHNNRHPAPKQSEREEICWVSPDSLGAPMGGVTGTAEVSRHLFIVIELVE